MKFILGIIFVISLIPSFVFAAVTQSAECRAALEGYQQNVIACQKEKLLSSLPCSNCFRFCQLVKTLCPRDPEEPWADCNEACKPGRRTGSTQ